MMKHFLFYVFCLATLFSCSPKDKVPKSVIQPEKMGDVVWDVIRMQFLAEEKAASDTSVNQEEELKNLTEKVFEIHKISAKKFDDSYNWYVKHPTLLKRIFDSMQVQKQEAHNVKEELIDGEPVSAPGQESKRERRNKKVMEEIK